LHLRVGEMARDSMYGQVIGNYRVTGTLGEGAVGVVYLAEHEIIGRKAATWMTDEVNRVGQLATAYTSGGSPARLLELGGDEVWKAIQKDLLRCPVEGGT